MPELTIQFGQVALFAYSSIILKALFIKMKKENLTVRTIILITGIFILAFGVAITIRSGLGTIPILSIPYVYNIAFPAISVGTITILLNLIFILIQIIILKKEYKSLRLLQIPILIIFGWFIDVHLRWMTNLTPSSYLQQGIYCILGCIIIAFGIFMQIKAEMSILPGEGLIIAVSNALKKDFGKIKIIFDSLLILISLVSIFVFLDTYEGVREGTIVSALLVGFILQFYNKQFTFIDKIIYPNTAPVDFVEEPYMTTDNFVITISRQYGSGGHEVGELVAKKLGVAFYDSNLIAMTAKESGFTPEYVKKHEQKLSNSWLYKLYKQNYFYVNEAIPPQDMLFLVQTKVIRDIAARESCVIVGRCADYILKGHPNSFNVFVHASDAFRMSRVIKIYGADPEDAEQEMEKVDKERQNHNEHYTERKWADLKDYDLTIESSLFGIDITAAMIIDARRKALYTNPLTGI